MLQLLEPIHYPRVSHLFSQDAFYCAGILSGKYPGRILVDSIEQPTGGLLIKDVWAHVGGDPTNESLVRAMTRTLNQRDMLGEEIKLLYFIDAPARWLAALNEAVEDRQLIDSPRRLFVATPDAFNGKRELPPKFELHPISHDLQFMVSGDLPQDIANVIRLREGADQPDKVAFGFVALDGVNCAAWAVIDFIVRSRAEIRLVTAEPYRRQQLATIISSAAIDYGLRTGLHEILWNVGQANIGSIRTAEKLGLTERPPSTEHILIYPEVGYYINLAFSHLDAGRLDETLAVAHRMQGLSPAILPQYGHFLAGAVQAAYGELADAFASLNQALDLGFEAANEFEAAHLFQSLRDDPAWAELMARLES